MSSEKTLLSISVHTDDDTGMYQVGEIDYGIMTGLVEDYIKHYGAEPLLTAISRLTHKIIEHEQKINREKFNDDNVQACAS